jgi:hypothetical protein
MNVLSALVATAVGAAFLGAATTYYYQPDFIDPDYTLLGMLETNHSKARAAVSRLLIDPASAQFELLRSVEADAAKYVCGNVNAKDKSGSYAGYHAFVYTVAIDFAHIDDDGRIAQAHGAFRPCPISEEEEAAQQKMAISPGALSIVKIIQKNITTDDPSALSTMASQTSKAGKISSGGTTEQQLGRLGGQSGSGGQQAADSGSKSASGSKAAPNNDNETEWRSDRPPAAWPMFAPDHPLGKPAARRTPAQAIALAKDVEDRWEQSKSGNPKIRPSSEEIREACRALLAINPKNQEFPKAWAAFVRLRKIDREAGQT